MYRNHQAAITLLVRLSTEGDVYLRSMMLSVQAYHKALHVELLQVPC